MATGVSLAYRCRSNRRRLPEEYLAMCWEFPHITSVCEWKPVSSAPRGGSIRIDEPARRSSDRRPEEQKNACEYRGCSKRTF
jgi:hypothetical protein